MPSKYDPADSLADIIENAERIEHCLERICEAAHRLGPLAAELMPEQPWGDIRGMGNRLRHAYGRVSLDVLWNAVRHDGPGLADDARQTVSRMAADRTENG